MCHIFSNYSVLFCAIYNIILNITKRKEADYITLGERYNIMNTITKIESGKIYTESTLNNRNGIFEIVEKIPSNYFIWSIGENMGTDEYIPICEDLHPEDKDNYEINTSTLKAIKLNVEEVKALREAAHVGINSKKTAEKAMKSKRRGYWSDRKREQAKKTIDIFRRITA